MGKTPITPDDTVRAESTIQRNLAILNAPAWRPERGTYKTGKIIGVRMGGIGNEYGTYPILVLENADGEIWAVHAFHTILQNQLKELFRPIGEDGKPVKRNPIGMTVTTWYGGVETSTKRVDSKGEPQTYHNYTVIEGDGTTLPEMDSFNWDAPEKK